MSYLFNSFKSLSSLPNISNWNTNKVIDMSHLFDNCSSLLTLPDLSKWNTSNVTNMSYFFNNCCSLLSLPDLSKWNTNNVTDMSYLFYNCSSLLTLPDLSKWNTSNVKNMSGLFCYCKSLSWLPELSKWNTNNVKNMSHLFDYCTSLLHLPDLSKWDTNNVIDMSYLFYNCSSLLHLPDLSKWNTNKVINISHLFDNCFSLLFLPNINKWNTNNVINMSGLFQNGFSLKHLPRITKEYTNYNKNMIESDKVKDFELQSSHNSSKINFENCDKKNYYICNIYSIKYISEKEKKYDNINRIQNEEIVFNPPEHFNEPDNSISFSTQSLQKEKRIDPPSSNKSHVSCNITNKNEPIKCTHHKNEEGIYICEHCDFIYCRVCGDKIMNLDIYNHHLIKLTEIMIEKEKEKDIFIKSFMNIINEYIIKCNNIITKKKDSQLNNSFQFPKIEDGKNFNCKIEFLKKINEIDEELIKLDNSLKNEQLIKIDNSFSNFQISDLLLNYLQNSLAQIIGEKTNFKENLLKNNDYSFINDD